MGAATAGDADHLAVAFRLLPISEGTIATFNLPGDDLGLEVAADSYIAQIRMANNGAPNRIGHGLTGTTADTFPGLGEFNLDNVEIALQIAHGAVAGAEVELRALL